VGTKNMDAGDGVITTKEILLEAPLETF